MADTKDIDTILDAWDSPAGSRKLLGADGAVKVQMRVEVNGHRGILQFNCDGRPDGERPHEKEFALDYHVAGLEAHLAAGLPAEEFLLSHEDAEELVAEGALTYQRYIVLLQMEDHARVIRDTERNMRLFRFLHRHAEDEDDADALEKWWPYIIRIHYTARALAAVEKKDFEGALAAVREAEREIVALGDSDDEVFLIERDRSVKALSEMETFFARRVPPEEINLLEARKLRAIEREDYERAARIRDRIDLLRDGLKKSD